MTLKTTAHSDTGSRAIGGDLIAILTPPIALLPVSLCAVVFKVIDRLQKNDLVPDLVARPSEVTETF
jgi:hypothetical protein